MAQHLECNYLNDCMELLAKRKFPYRNILIYENPKDSEKHSCDGYFFKLLPKDGIEDKDVKYVVYFYRLDNDFSFELHISKDKKVIKTFEVL